MINNTLNMLAVVEPSEGLAFGALGLFACLIMIIVGCSILGAIFK